MWVFLRSPGSQNPVVSPCLTESQCEPIEVTLDRSASWQAEVHRLLHQVVVGDEEGAAVQWGTQGEMAVQLRRRPHRPLLLEVRANLNNFWWTWEPTWRTFDKFRAFFLAFLSEFTKRNFGCEFGFLFCQKKKYGIVRKFAMLAPRSTKSYSNRPAS